MDIAKLLHTNVSLPLTPNEVTHQVKYPIAVSNFNSPVASEGETYEVKNKYIASFEGEDYNLPVKPKRHPFEDKRKRHYRILIYL